MSRRMLATCALLAALGGLAVAAWWSERPTGDHDAHAPAPTPPAPLERWSEGEDHGRWTVRYTGYGQVLGSEDELLLHPRAADSADITHAALVHTREDCLDAGFALTVRTETQLRQGAPNPWEVGWVLWNFRDDTHFYAVALKPNGWEITKQDPSYPGNQRFVATGEEPRFPVGVDHRVAVQQDWPRMTVTVDGEELATVVDRDDPYRGGAIGLYTEDAGVRFSDIDIPTCSTS